MMLVLLVGKCDGGRSHVVGDRWEVKVGVVGFRVSGSWLEKGTS